MSGHSKWASIKHKKGVVDARRGKLFAKLIRGIEVAAREGGTSNPANDMTLAAAWDRAKSSGVPSDTIERAAKRGAGETGENVHYERVLYEGYATGGVAVLVEALTENRNRTSSDIRSAFGKNGGNLGEPGSVAWMFERKGLIVVANTTEDDVILAAADAGADDVQAQDEGRFEIVTDAKDFTRVRKAVEDGGLQVETAELTMIPTTTIEVDANGARPILRLLDALEELDDVQGVFANFDAPDEAFAEVS